jgi:hypothetical protein
MKAEKRKELHTNALADSINRFVARLKEKPGQTSYMIWGIVILVAGTAIAGYYFFQQRKKANSARWEQLAEAGADAESLNRIIKNNKDTPAGRDARLQLARLQWAGGQSGLLDDKKTDDKSGSDATTKLTEAAKSFEELAGEYASDAPIIAQECYLSAGKIHVSLGNYDQGLKLYRELAKKYPKSEFGKQAGTLADDLEKNRSSMDQVLKKLKENTLLPGPSSPPIPPPGSAGG